MYTDIRAFHEDLILDHFRDALHEDKIYISNFARDGE